MRKKIMIYILMAVGTLFLLTGCKKNVGTPEDNAVTDESDDKKEDTDQEKKVFGFCGIESVLCNTERFSSVGIGRTGR